MKQSLILLFVVFALLSCEAENEDTIQNTGIVGVWNWLRTDGGFAFHIHESPETTGKTIKLCLTEDKKFRILENDLEVASGTYSLSLMKSIYSGELADYITYEGDYSDVNVVIAGIIEVLDNNILTIADNCYDGIGSTFERVD